MKQFIGLLIILVTLTSCSEKFEIKDHHQFNKKIESRTDIKTVGQLIKIYYNYPPEEETPNLAIESRQLDNGFMEITLIHDRLQDDSQSAIKIVMTAMYYDNKWIAHQIKKNWKCYDGRGHTYWGIERCE